MCECVCVPGEGEGGWFCMSVTFPLGQVRSHLYCSFFRFSLFVSPLLPFCLSHRPHAIPCLPPAAIPISLTLASAPVTQADSFMSRGV